MPSQRHELLVELFRHRPSLAAELLCEALHIRLPSYSQVHSDTLKSAQIALTARKGTEHLDPDRRQLYTDLVLSALSEAARQELQKMDPATYEYQSEFGRHCVAKGRAEGKAEGQIEGRCDVLIQLLTLRFGTLSTAQQARIRQASIADLDAIGERVLTASTLKEVLQYKSPT